MIMSADKVLTVAAESARHHLTDADVDGVFQFASGLVASESFSLALQLIQIGLLVVLVFVIAVRRV